MIERTYEVETMLVGAECSAERLLMWVRRWSLPWMNSQLLLCLAHLVQRISAYRHLHVANSGDRASQRHVDGQLTAEQQQHPVILCCDTSLASNAKQRHWRAVTRDKLYH